MRVKYERDWLRRFLLPGLAFKGVVIGGGYATGRELATFFLPAGPRGGLYGMLLAGSVWSVVCAITFLFAVRAGTYDYRSFFARLLGPFGVLFEVGYTFALILTLAIFAAASGAIGAALFGWPPIAGALALVLAISIFAMFGNKAVESLFLYVSALLYLVYMAMLILSVTRFGDRMAAAFVTPRPPLPWVQGGLTYASYNAVGAVIVLPMIRHLRSGRDAVIAGMFAGPLAMAPAVLFFIAMCAFYPGIGNQTIPSDFILGQLHLPVFRLLFQAMIFAALLESGTGGVHAINERIAGAWRRRGHRDLGRGPRLAVTGALLFGSVFVADAVGLVQLIANGYRYVAYLFLAIYLAPILTIGLWRATRPGLAPLPAEAPLRPLTEATA